MRGPAVPLSRDEVRMLREVARSRAGSATGRRFSAALVRLAAPGATTRGVARQLRMSRMRLTSALARYRAGGVLAVIATPDEPTGRSRLPEAAVRRVRELKARHPAMGMREIARRTGVSLGSVHAILRS